MGLLNFLRLRTAVTSRGDEMSQVEYNQDWDITSTLMFLSGLYSLCTFIPSIETGITAGRRWLSKKLWSIKKERQRLQYREILSHDADMLFETPDDIHRTSSASSMSPLQANTLQVVYPSRNVPTLVDGEGLNEIFGGPIPHPWTLGNTFVERAIGLGGSPPPEEHGLLPSNLDVIEVFSRAFRLERWMSEFPVRVDFSTLYSFLTKELQVDYTPGGRSCIEVWSYDSNGSRRCKVYEPGDSIRLPLSQDSDSCPFSPVTVTADATFFVLSPPDLCSTDAGDETLTQDSEDEESENGSWEIEDEEVEEATQGDEATTQGETDNGESDSSSSSSEEDDDSSSDEEEEEDDDDDEEQEKVDGFYSMDATPVFMAWARHKIGTTEMNKLLPFIIRELVMKDARLRDIFYTPNMDVWAVRLSVEYSDKTGVTFILDQRGLTEYKKDKEGMISGIDQYMHEPKQQQQ